MKILMVCLGNICRSPLADALLRKKIEENNLPIEVDSAGTSAYHIGNPPDERTQQNALKHGLDMGFLRARQFVYQDFGTFDKIYVMDRTNEFNVLELAKTETEKGKVSLLLNEIPDIEKKEVPDPYYLGEQGFEKVYQLIDQATDCIIQKLKI